MAEILFIVPVDELTVKKEVNGTLLLATRLLQAGFDTQVLRFGQIDGYGEDYAAFLEKITERILAEKPRCVSFYCLWPTFHIMLRIARELKVRQPELTVVLGGPQATATAQDTMEAMAWVDFICTGEGENTVVPFFTALLRGGDHSEIPGLFYRAEGRVARCDREPPLCDLNEEPYWDDRLYRHLYTQVDAYTRSANYYMPVDVGRGCPYSCAFCCTSHFWRRTYRLKSPERIVAEMKRLNRMFGIRSFSLTHDAFTINHNLVSQVCDRILEEGLDFRWRCSTRIDCITEELILKMKQAGMRGIEVGIETGSPRMQKLINKNLNLDKARKMIDFLLKQKLEVYVFFIYGFPEETEEELAQTLNMALGLLDKGARGVLMSQCCFTPTTSMTEKCYDQLIFEPNKTSIFREFWGDDEDLALIRQNKAVFPVYYDLPTPVRREYEHLWALVSLYTMLPRTMTQLRRLCGDDLKLYRLLVQSNQGAFAQGDREIKKRIAQDPGSLVENLAAAMNGPWLRQLKGLLAYEQDVRWLRSQGVDREIRRVYDFLYADLKLGRPIESYLRGSTEILLRRSGGLSDMQVLGMKLED